jgi:eukaryotic-like serine/threonine-protein kinase
MTATLATPEALREALRDRYRVERPLGAGGMATVFLAHDLRHGREVAVKVLHADVGGAVGRDRFLREIRLAAGLTHPHILPLHDSGEADGLLFYVMPVMRGQTLRDLIAAGAPLPLEQCLRIGADVADALDYAHRQQVVHRDIKPENILLHEGHAVVADFGIGKALAAAAFTSTQTQVGLTLGTPAYMSPEQAAGDELDGRSDLFSLGCVLYEMLTATPPFSGGSAAALIAQRFTHTPPGIGTRRADVPPVVAALVDSLLAREPAERPATGAIVATALRAPTPAAMAAAPVAPAPNSLAVLPFVNMSAHAESDYFTDGLTEEIITSLARVHALHVTSRTSSLQHKGSTRSMRELGRSLGVRYLLTGSVRRAGDALRIAAQLVDAAEDRQLWGDTFRGTLHDVFDVQERVAREIVTALDVTLRPEEDARLAARGWRHAAAYDLALQAKAEMWRLTEPDGWRQLLARAEAIEGSTPVLRGLRLWGEVMLLKFGIGDARALPGIVREAASLVREAPTLAAGYAVLAYAAIERGDMAEAILRFREALERDPSDTDARFWLMAACGYSGLFAEAVMESHEMLARDPLAPISWMSTTFVPFFTGAMASTLPTMDRVLSMQPTNIGGRWQRAYALTCAGFLEGARGDVDWLLGAAPAQPYTVQADALLRVASGDRSGGLALLDGLDLQPFDAHLTFHFAEVFAAAGEISRALDVLGQSIRKGFTPVPFIEKHCPLLEPLRGERRFAELLEEAAARSETVRRRVTA